MSQQIFPVREGVEAMVGWDRMLESFFGQVYNVDKFGERTDDEIIHWVGAGLPQIRTVEQLEQALKPHVERLPDDVHHELKLVEVD